MGETSTINLFDGWRATFEPCQQWLVIRLHPPDGPGQYGLAVGLWSEIDHRGAREVILEMDEVAFFPSALMAELVRLHKRIAVAGGRLRLCSLQEHPREALHTMRLDQMLGVYDSREEALQETSHANE